MRRFAWLAVIVALVLAGCGTGRVSPKLTAIGPLKATVAAPMVNELLTSTQGTWGNSPTAFSYQWLTCDAVGNNCSAITSATGSTFTITTGQLGGTIRAQVTATNAKGSATQQSAATGVVAAGSSDGIGTIGTAVPAPTGTIYYVSPTGNDTTNNGTSQATAWKTVGKVDAAALQPGDAVYFQGGASFTDNSLSPGGGANLNGSQGHPITFGSYGTGQAYLQGGVWFNGDNHLAFQNLKIGADAGFTSSSGFQGNGLDIMIVNDTIQHVSIGINAEGTGWTIANNTVQFTGDSGLLIGYTAGTAGGPAGGDNIFITGNTIDHTGQDATITYGTHGIYDKFTNSVITNNTITNFHDDGVSVRYRNSALTGNQMSGGGIGIGYFEYDTVAGLATWTGNTISNVTDAGIFVCGTLESCSESLQSYTITGNNITNLGSGAVAMNLQPIFGTYTLG